MKRSYIPGTTIRFFGIMLLLICVAGLAHYAHLFNRHEAVTRLQQQSAQQHLHNIRSLYQIFKDDRRRLTDARIQSTVFVDYKNHRSIKAVRSLQDYYEADYKNSLVAFACGLEAAVNSQFKCHKFDLAVQRTKDSSRLRRIDFQYIEKYKMQTELFTHRLGELQWVALRNDQTRQNILHGFLLLQIWGIWMITYGEMLSRTPKV